MINGADPTAHNKKDVAALVLPLHDHLLGGIAAPCATLRQRRYHSRSHVAEDRDPGQGLGRSSWRCGGTAHGLDHDRPTSQGVSAGHTADLRNLVRPTRQTPAIGPDYWLRHIHSWTGTTKIWTLATMRAR